MKFFNWFYVSMIPLLFVALVGLQLHLRPSNRVNPVSAKYDFYFQLNQALTTAKIKPINLKVNDFQNEVEFLIKNNDSDFTKVIFSTKKNAVWQVTSLQQALKIAKIKDTYIKKIDLSITHPYATF